MKQREHHWPLGIKNSTVNGIVDKMVGGAADSRSDWVGWEGISRE